MMRNILILSVLILGLWRCQDKENVFDVSMQAENISFYPIAGGSVMHYKLPAEAEVLAIRVRYRDAQGQHILRTGSYACDSLQLLGFNEARKDVEAYVTLCDRDNVESEPVKVTFDTQDSGPVVFFDKLKVFPNWNGFSISYDVPQNVDGMAHVFYVGKNPLTGESDTLLVSSFQIMEGQYTLPFPLKNSGGTNTVVIRTEDFRGYMVKEEVWKDVTSYNTAKLDPSKFDFLDPLKLSCEDPQAKLGIHYLFDGDLKGETCFQIDGKTFKTFLAGPNANGKPFIIDFREPRLAAQMKIYAMLNIRSYFPGTPYWADPEPGIYGPIWMTNYYNKLPSSVTVYASNNKDDGESWEKIGHFEQSPDLTNNLRWGYGCANDYDYNTALKTMDAILAAQPKFMTIDFPATGKAYRYLKLVVDKIFERVTMSHPLNVDQYVTMHELEVYTNKD